MFTPDEILNAYNEFSSPHEGSGPHLGAFDQGELDSLLTDLPALGGQPMFSDDYITSVSSYQPLNASAGTPDRPFTIECLATAMVNDPTVDETNIDPRVDEMNTNVAPNVAEVPYTPVAEPPPDILTRDAVAQLRSSGVLFGRKDVSRFIGELVDRCSEGVSMTNALAEEKEDGDGVHAFNPLDYPMATDPMTQRLGMAHVIERMGGRMCRAIDTGGGDDAAIIFAIASIVVTATNGGSYFDPFRIDTGGGVEEDRAVLTAVADDSDERRAEVASLYSKCKPSVDEIARVVRLGGYVLKEVACAILDRCPPAMVKHTVSDEVLTQAAVVARTLVISQAVFVSIQDQSYGAAIGEAAIRAHTKPCSAEEPRSLRLADLFSRSTQCGSLGTLIRMRTSLVILIHLMDVFASHESTPADERFELKACTNAFRASDAMGLAEDHSDTRLRKNLNELRNLIVSELLLRLTKEPAGPFACGFGKAVANVVVGNVLPNENRLPVGDGGGAEISLFRIALGFHTETSTKPDTGFCYTPMAALAVALTTSTLTVLGMDMIHVQSRSVRHVSTSTPASARNTPAELVSVVAMAATTDMGQIPVVQALENGEGHHDRDYVPSTKRYVSTGERYSDAFQLDPSLAANVDVKRMHTLLHAYEHTKPPVKIASGGTTQKWGGNTAGELVAAILHSTHDCVHLAIHSGVRNTDQARNSNNHSLLIYMVHVATIRVTKDRPKFALAPVNVQLWGINALALGYETLEMTGNVNRDTFAKLSPSELARRTGEWPIRTIASMSMLLSTLFPPLTTLVTLNLLAKCRDATLEAKANSRVTPDFDVSELTEELAARGIAVSNSILRDGSLVARDNSDCFAASVLEQLWETARATKIAWVVLLHLRAIKTTSMKEAILASCGEGGYVDLGTDPGASDLFSPQRGTKSRVQKRTFSTTKAALPKATRRRYDYAAPLGGGSPTLPEDAPTAEALANLFFA